MARTFAAGVAAAALAALLGACGAAEPAPEAAADETSHADRERGVAVRVPAGWTVVEQPLTSVVVPRELVALATFPLRGTDKGGGPCALEPELARMPADGALVRLLEYRPLLGDVWADLQRSSFPPRPPRFRLTHAQLGPGTCGTGLGYTTTFSAADRPLHLWLAFGLEVTEARLREVEQILDSLELAELLPPPPDPYAGWPLVTTNPGDSLRPPPAWVGAAAMFPPDKTPRPRPLFFASNRPLPGLPAKLVPYVEKLPGPGPEEAIGEDFPRDGVLLWVLEERKGGPSEAFPPLDRHWPRAADFQPAGTCSLRVCRLRAAASWQGYRFSVWIAAGPDAATSERELALKSAASLAVSGCWRDQLDDCPDQRPSPTLLERNGVSVAVPSGWDGRLLFRDTAGASNVMFQVANFELPPNEGFEPPQELPPGQEDPIKAMGAGDVLVMITSDEPSGEPAPATISLNDLRFLPAGARRIPVGHRLAHASFCLDRRCFRIEVDFGEHEPPPDLQEHVSRVLASLRVSRS